MNNRDVTLDKFSCRVSQSLRGAAISQIAFPSPSVGEMIGWCTDRTFYAVPAFKTHVYSSRRYSENATSGSDTGIFHAVYCDWTKRSFVFGGLLKFCCPTTVIRRVITGRVEPINRMIKAWALAHIGQERDKRFLPPGADLNSHRSIMGKVLEFGIAAPSFHAKPYFICRAFRGIDPMAVLKAAIRFIHVDCIRSSLQKGNPQ